MDVSQTFLLAIYALKLSQAKALQRTVGKSWHTRLCLADCEGLSRKKKLVNLITNQQTTV